MTKISYLGPIGTYSEQAASAYAHWWSDQTQQPLPELVPFPSITQTLYEVAEGRIDIAIAPVENSIEGSVTTTLDTLWQVEQLEIRQSFMLPIVHVLIAQTIDMKTIHKVYSHPQPLGQCRDWLHKNLPDAELIPTSSTAEALKLVEDGTAAIASERAAQIYDMLIVARSIQDYADNSTRFLAVSRPNLQIQMPTLTGASVCTSIAFSLVRNSPGALVKLLQIFADRQINLSRIESRPSKRSLGDYIFFVDAESCLSSSCDPVLDLLEQNTERLRVLGYYHTLPALSQ